MKWRIEFRCKKCFPAREITEYLDLDVDSEEQARDAALQDRDLRQCPNGHMMKVAGAYRQFANKQENE